MAISCEPSSLASAASCYQCIPKEMQMPILIKLFCTISGMTCEPSSLAQSATCFACIPQNLQMPVLIYLACAIANGGTGGGGGVLCGTVNPTDAPTGTCGIYYRTDTGEVWVWDGAVWQQILLR